MGHGSILITSKQGEIILSIKYLENAFYRLIIMLKAFKKHLELPVIQSPASGALRCDMEKAEKSLI